MAYYIAVSIPFDSVCVAASISELRSFVGAKVQGCVQVSPRTLAIHLYWQGSAWLWISWDQEFGRICLGPNPSRSRELSPFAAELKKRVGGDRMVSIEQTGRDRIVRVGFQSGQVLVVEVMGRHANAILLDPEGKQVAAAKWVGSTQSVRPVLPGKPYVLPPGSGGLSPFIRRFPDRVADAEQVFNGDFKPCSSPVGVYPISLGLPSEEVVAQFGLAAGAWYAAKESERAVEQARNTLHAQLMRIASARHEAIEHLTMASDSAARASEFQMMGELTLAFGFQAPAGTTQLEVVDYTGAPLLIPYNSSETPPENAERWFKKARRAKDGIAEVSDQLARLSEDLREVEALLANLPHYISLAELEQARQFAESHHWLHRSGVPKKKEDRPFEGHRVKELAAPHGYSVFYGENAEANDYLTMRMGKPNDIWMHVRGNTSAHILIPTHNQPDRVPTEVLLFGAQVSARHSPLKHSSMVPVDYTLKKYVRRPRGGAKGFVTYTREKTLHVAGVK